MAYHGVLWSPIRTYFGGGKVYFIVMKVSWRRRNGPVRLTSRTDEVVTDGSHVRPVSQSVYLSERVAIN